MPEYPDVTVYVEALEARIRAKRLERLRVIHPFLLRTYSPSPGDAEGRSVIGVRRLGKQIVIALEGELFLVLHLMIAGRLRWEKERTAVPRKLGLAGFDFEGGGCLILTEAGTKKRASLHIVSGVQSLSAFDRGGLEVFEAGVEKMEATLKRENHTLKRALSDPRLISGVGNAYSDEILHAARLSPFKQTRTLTADETARLLESCRSVLDRWTTILRSEAAGSFPSKVTAFRKEMAVHGRFGKPCPVCGSAVQRIVYAENECNYCPACQTGGKLLADRALSRLLKEDWPSTLAELEELKSTTRGAE